ncbi:mismatch-specific DNA-glycosylase [Nocardioides aurantiacus]|uniref:mismatch-specific DNA-glycosylase n=1 Tax=Nocardioides aurantiacus TaxID=86796 RepID=UPI00403F9BCE
MHVLPDVVGADPTVVFCGRAGIDSPKAREHRYEAPGNRFWSLLHDSGMTPRLLRPDEEAELPAYGLGSTDLVRTGPEWTRPSSYAVAELVAKVERWQPEWLAFTSKTVAALVARAEGRRPPGLGPHDWYVGGAQVFVLPGTSGANQRKDYDGRVDRLSWFTELAQLSGACAPS